MEQKPVEDELTTVATFTTTAEAGLARERLELEGVRAFVFDQVGGTMMSYANAGGSVRLQVATEDLQRAREALGLTEP